VGPVLVGSGCSMYEFVVVVTGERNQLCPSRSYSLQIETGRALCQKIYKRQEMEKSMGCL